MNPTAPRAGTSRTEVLVDHLRRRIVSGELAVGHKLPSENQLVAEHGVSRTVVREAMTRLQAEGLVHTRRGSGSFVLTPPSGAGVGAQVPHEVPASTLAERLDLIDYRVAIESEAAALAAARRSGESADAVTRAERAFAERARAGIPAQPAELLALDFAFHRSVAEASGNPLLLQALDVLGPAMIAMPRARLDQSGEEAGAGRRSAVVAAEHAAVAAAVAAGDALGAAAAMRGHLRNSARRFLAESTGRSTD
ncbi:FadR/GntR family transcriptional regulator [Citricoccus sp.]|uniref:FadR/GntR family transcriptional regulator n=1 Tax=Citricoccus sp. TaxID=1978372 RepID=UPI0026018B25|nr:GntR family transcriptional regulator [Citricoccus sp.]HRO30670.1 GntR family transcriptional regulator [Citricoccus sp.]HRO94229.1 GntR family transcriptional regulator [Citricoccus sp.]